MLVDISQIKDPDILGEMFRELFFEQDEKTLGCYNSFKLKPDVKNLGKQITEQGEGIVANLLLSDNTNVEMFYTWEDGDGFLMFTTNEFAVGNYDCKKTYGWMFL